MTTPTTFAEAEAAVLAANPQATPEEVVAAITAVPAPDYLEVPPRFQRVPAKFFRNFLLISGEWGAISVAATDSGTPAPIRALAQLTLELLRAGDDPVDFLDPAVRTVFGTALQNLVAATLVSEATAITLVARVQPPQSWAQHTGWAPTA